MIIIIYNKIKKKKKKKILYIVYKYIEDGNYDKAVTLSKDLSLDSSALFQKLASECIIDLEKYGNVFNADALNEQSKAWKKLEEYLKIYENSENFSHYKKVIMDTLFSLDQQMVLPKWFIEQYKQKHTEDAIRIYLKYNRIEDATKLLIHQCQKYIESCAPPKTRIWISYALLDQVKLALKEKIKDIRFEKLKFEKYELGYVKYDTDTNSDSEESSNKNSNNDSDSDYRPNSNTESESSTENESENKSEDDSGSINGSKNNSHEEEGSSYHNYNNESDFSEEETRIFNSNENDSESDNSILFSEMPSSRVTIAKNSNEMKQEYELKHKKLTEEIKNLEKLYFSLKQKIDAVLKL